MQVIKQVKSQENCNKLQTIINEAKGLINSNSVEYQGVYNIKNKIEDSIEVFKNNIIKPIDKSKLNKKHKRNDSWYMFYQLFILC